MRFLDYRLIRYQWVIRIGLCLDRVQLIADFLHMDGLHRQPQKRSIRIGYGCLTASGQLCCQCRSEPGHTCLPDMPQEGLYLIRYNPMPGRRQMDQVAEITGWLLCTIHQQCRIIQVHAHNILAGCQCQCPTVQYRDIARGVLFDGVAHQDRYNVVGGTLLHHIS